MYMYSMLFYLKWPSSEASPPSLKKWTGNGEFLDPLVGLLKEIVQIPLSTLALKTPTCVQYVYKLSKFKEFLTLY